jgi:leucyl aminopeptidase
MELKISIGKPETEKASALALVLPQATLAGETAAGDYRKTIYSSQIARLYRQKDFVGKLEETAWLYPVEGNAERLLLVGLGEWNGKTPKENEARQNARLAIGYAVQAARKLGIEHLHLWLNGPFVEKFGYRQAAQLAAEALLLANYRF